MLITRPAPGTHTRQSSGPTIWRHLDVVLIAVVILISAFGSVMVYSSTRVALEFNGVSPDYYLKKQVVFIAIGLAAMFVVAAIDYRRWRDFAPIIYGICLLMLLAVFKLGSRVNGGQSWFQIGSFELEPSEFAKLGLILALAAYASRFRGRLTVRSLVVLLVMAGVPFVLVYKQPDLGTALVLAAVVIAMVAIAGARLRHLAILAVIAIVGVVGLVEAGVLHKYQIERLSAFVNTPNQVSSKFLSEHNDTAESEYNAVESKDAISNGGITGTGLYKGTSTNLSQVPEQHTDFIFSAAGEQVGLVGCAILLALFLLVMWRTWQASTMSRDLFGTLVAVGVLAMLVFQVFENIGMAMGMMPVTGIPLPWMSYGGSAIIAEFVAVGLILSIRMRRFG